MFDEAAVALGCRVTQVTQLIRDGLLVAGLDPETAAGSRRR